MAFMGFVLSLIKLEFIGGKMLPNSDRNWQEGGERYPCRDHG